ncbi:NOG1 family protein [Vulcanisaeta thermophila]|uniref:NOG1 family protein n=1 Tax=Vulcanisaeta thermophila TaxID=867917 RepID=UPI000852D48C|nr:GTPase [Vulcanisaeta thermophila]
MSIKHNLPHVPSAEELISGVRGMYFSIQARSPSVEVGIDRLRRLELKRIKEVRNYLISTFRDVAMGMPFLDSVHPFYRELISLLIDVNEYRHSLGKVAHASKAVASIYRDAVIGIRSAVSREDIVRSRRKFLSRIYDLINDLKPELDYLKYVVSRLDKLPDIDPGIFTIVVAGAPNVGKSSFVRCISSGKPRVAEYPFTTKELHVGHLTVLNDFKIQVIDTPGLLDRPLSERNKIELQAVLALRYLARVIVFILDPTMHSGYSLKEQLNILREVHENINAPMLVLINKVDMASEDDINRTIDGARRVDDSLRFFRTSTINCLGCDNVVDHIVRNYVIPTLLAGGAR